MKQELILKLIEMLVGNSDDTKEADAKLGSAVGKYVICRSRNDGVNFGKVVSYADRFIELSECQRLHYFSPASESTAWYEGVAEFGISEDSRISQESHKVINEDFSITFCSEKCVESIKGHKHHAKK